MTNTSEIGVLLLDKATGSQIGFIQFSSSGMLVYQMIKKLHVFALKPLDALLAERWLTEPLPRKHAKLLDENLELPDEVLEQEANSCANFLNSLESPLKLGNCSIRAQVIRHET